MLPAPRNRAGRRARQAALLLAVLLAAVGCGGGGNGGGTGGGKVVEGGTLRVGTNDTIDSMNPFVGFNQLAYTAYQYLYPSLLVRDAKLQLVGDFAERWESSSDGKTWTFKTRANATWSDGKPLTAKDTAWTINTIVKFKDGPASNAAGYVANITKAEAPDDTTLVVTYDTPLANALSKMASITILPEHVWSPLAAGKGEKLKTFQNNVPIVSAGPFNLERYTKKQIALFKKNPTFYGPKPRIDGFGIRFFATQDPMVAALRAGELDYVNEVPAAALDNVKRAGFNVVESPGLEWKNLIFNSTPSKPRNRELLDPKVREAFEHAIDRQRIVDVAWLGHARPGTTIVPPALGDWHDSSVQPAAFDLAKANQLLDEAGFRRGAGGIRMANGHPMRYQVIFPEIERGGGDRTFQIIQADLAKVGIGLTQRNLDDTAAFEAVIAPDNKYLEFDLAMWDWVPEIDPDFILSVLTCEQYGGWSDTGYCDKSYDKMYADQAALLETGARRDLIHQMQRKVANERPYIVLNYQNVLEAHGTKWAGFVPSPMESLNPLSKQTLTEVHRTG
jgi:peptide/nickel transport system substrate-binding protein